jgi:aerobic carbon-monoxide dehydrogenase small subunit
MQVSVTVNSTLYAADVEPRMLLSDFLRDELGLTGVKVGCDTGQCGTCNVLLDGQSVKSCMVLAVQADGADITTVEGLSETGHLNALQEGMMECHGVQCGFCTPGMVIALTDLLEQESDPSEEQIRTALEGTLCRCTGYQNVVRAAKYAVAKTNSPVQMIVDTPGKRFYQRQVEYLIAGDADALVEDNYNDDAVLTSAEFIVKGKEALKQHFRNYLRWVTIKAVKSTDKFVETDNTVLFEATVESNHGVVSVYDAFVLEDGKIAYHFTGVK